MGGREGGWGRGAHPTMDGQRRSKVKLLSLRLLLSCISAYDCVHFLFLSFFLSFLLTSFSSSFSFLPVLLFY